MPGHCALCSQCSTCVEGPNGFPGGCGFCKFCSEMSCPPPECVDVSQATHGLFLLGAMNDTSSSRSTAVYPKLLVRNVNTWYKEWGAMIPPHVTTAAQCKQECMLTKGCNGWSFCYNKDGCSGVRPACNTVPVWNKVNASSTCVDHGPYSECYGEKYPPFTCMLVELNKTVSIQAPVIVHAPGWTSGINSENQYKTRDAIEGPIPCKLKF